MIYIFNHYGQLVREFEKVAPALRFLKTSTRKLNKVIDTNVAVNDYFVSSKPTLGKFDLPTTIYVYNHYGNLVDVVLTYESLFNRVTETRSKKRLIKFYNDENEHAVRVLKYRYYKEGHVPNHVSDLNKKYTLLDKEGFPKAYFSKVQDIADYLGVTRQTINKQCRRPDGYVRKEEEL